MEQLLHLRERGRIAPFYQRARCPTSHGLTDGSESGSVEMKVMKAFPRADDRSHKARPQHVLPLFRVPAPTPLSAAAASNASLTRRRRSATTSVLDCSVEDAAKRKSLNLWSETDPGNARAVGVSDASSGPCPASNQYREGGSFSSRRRHASPSSKFAAPGLSTPSSVAPNQRS